ncbi:MAG: translation initiation factor IF-2 N-terminal domain-containing protein, partial [Verrucomicrobiae bacterium]|nr:translation initiation factor IF-2 N-terminal domain-containing protein [Verrucomicrobiae bacterium]
MPVRIYDIAKRHGISSKDVIDKLIESGFAKSDQKLKPSSTIDKVTAEELEKLLPPVSLPGVQESSEHGHVVEGQTLTAEMPSVMEGAAPASGVSTGDTSVEAVATASAGISSVVASEKEVSEGAVESAVTTVEKEVGVEVPASGEGTSGEGINEVAVAGGVKGDSILEDVQEVSQEVEVGAVSEKSEGGAGVVVPTAGEVVGAQEGQEKVSEVKTEGAESVLNQGVASSESESVVEGGLESTV